MIYITNDTGTVGAVGDDVCPNIAIIGNGTAGDTYHSGTVFTTTHGTLYYKVIKLHGSSSSIGGNHTEGRCSFATGIVDVDSNRVGVAFDVTLKRTCIRTDAPRDGCVFITNIVSKPDGFIFHVTAIVDHSGKVVPVVNRAESPV